MIFSFDELVNLKKQKPSQNIIRMCILPLFKGKKENVLLQKD